MKKIIIGLFFLTILLIIMFFNFFSLEDFFVSMDNKSDDNLSITTEVLQDDLKKYKNTYNLYLTISDKNLSSSQKVTIRGVKIIDIVGKEINIQASSIKYYSSEFESFFDKMPLVLKRNNYILFSCEDIILPNSFIVCICYVDPLNENKEYKIMFKKKKRIVLNILTV